VLLAMQGLDAPGIEASINKRFAALLQARAAKVTLKSVA
jgi:hypothetical protein